jgi:GNAT superfamily N-acetyltransferase
VKPDSQNRWKQECGMTSLRPLLAEDDEQVIEVYRDAVLSQAADLYSPSQIEAWAHHAGRDPGFRSILRRGVGLASCSDPAGRCIEAFALLDPLDRLSLLYCRGRAARQGRGTALVRALESHALRSGCRRLRTEASFLSRPLLERLGWCVEAEEEVLLAGENFRRWRMIRDLGGAGRSP